MDTIHYIQQLIDRKPEPPHFQKIISALRGPDLIKIDDFGHVPPGRLDRLKYLTTGRIRAIVAPGYNGTVTHQPLSEAELRERDNFLRYAPTHFCSHYFEAVQAIKAVYGYDLQYESEIKDVTKKGSVVSGEANSGVGSGGGADLRKAWSAMGDF